MVIAFGGVLPAASQPARSHVELEGLESPVQISRDTWGIAHIYAETEADLFFAQGYQAARDRLFQLEIWRRRATGTLAEILGPRAVEHDIGARLYAYRGDLEAELNHYHPRGASIIRSFVAGVNAYIDLVRSDTSLLPVEFRLLGIRPEPWTPEVVVSRHQGLLSNVSAELDYGRAVSMLGPDRVIALSNFQPGIPDLGLDSTLDASRFFDDILALYHAFKRGVPFEAEDLASVFGGGPGVGTADGGAAANPIDEGRNLDLGSNNWVVDGRRSLSGYPLLANDPHRTQAVPSLRYWIHLVGPGWNVIGGGEPSIPGVSIGHNEHGAWGLTVFNTDSEDLYVYETRPGNPNAYRYQGRWLPMEVIRDTIRVEDATPVVVDLKFTRHGPVVYEDPEYRWAYAVRAAWLEAGGAPYLASLRMNQATNWEEFREACRFSHIPGENMVWAGRDGTIGWQAVGIAPIRPNWSGLVPVPGDGRYEWNGYLPMLAKPHTVNPPDGFVATANENRVPAGYPYREAVGWTWADPYRSLRIHEVLGSAPKVSVADMAALQVDVLSIPARTLVPMLSGLAASDDQTRTALQLLQNWDFRLAATSVEAGIYVAWERRLLDRLEELMVPEEARPYVENLSMQRAIDWLTVPPPQWALDPVAFRDSLLIESLEAAVAGLDERFGDDVEAWRYGQEGYKHISLTHSLSEIVGPQVRESLDVGPSPRGGNGFTVNSTGHGDNQPSGASFRIIVDTADWDRTLGMNTPGQSGNPDSPYYDNLFERWARDQFIPIYFSREAVDAATVDIHSLLPRAMGSAND